MAAASFRYYRFEPTTLRTPGSSVQISEFAVLLAGTRLTGMSISATHNTTAAGEEASKAGDNNTATKWCNTSGLPTTLIYDFTTATAADGYRWATANDATGRDPVSWTVSGSLDGTTWVVLDTQTDYATTASRSTFLSDFAFSLYVPTTVLSGASTSLTLSVQVAWGADLTAADAGWTWHDITPDLMVDNGEQIKYSLGRQDEAATSQPASCELRLDNRTGAYSLGPQSSNWPYVKRNTPLRLVVGGDATATVFQGYVDSWQPDWDQSGQYAVVNVTASGILRRLGQGKAPILSAIRHAMRDLIGVNLLEYWPMEDGKNATEFSSDIPGHLPLTVNSLGGGIPKFADASPFACSAPIANLNYAWLDGRITPYADTGELQVRALIEFPANGMNDGVEVMSLEMDLGNSTVEAWSLSYGTGGSLRLRGYDPDGGVLADSTTILFDVDGKRLRVGFYLQRSGANINWRVTTLAPDASSALAASGTFTSLAVGRALEVGVQTGLITAGEPIVGHITLQNAVTNIFTDAQQLNAYTGEGALDRIDGVCSENSIPFTIVDDGGFGPAMGPQSVSDVLTLLREAETVDQGILHDGQGAGITYVARNKIVNRAFNEFNAQNGRIRAIEPIDDDQALRNKVTVTRAGGGTITDEDSTGPLGTGAGGVGIYDDSVTVNCETDAQLPDYAGWLVAHGTVEGYRWPRITMDLRDLSSSQVSSILGLQLMRRLDLSHVASYRTQLADENISIVPTGWSGVIDKHRWEITLACAPYAPWRVVLLDETDEDHGLRPNTSGSTLAAAAAAGATSLSVATPSGPLWTTDSGDFPMTVEVGDLPVTVSAISGGSSPQTFTCTAIALARASGATVTLPRGRPILDLEDEA